MSKRKLSTFERLRQGKMCRKQCKELVRRLYSDDPGLEVVHHHVAGIDVGNESHFVAVTPGCDLQPVREFGSWTADLVRMAEWLKSCAVKMVVMQSTGVYWIAVYEVLEKAGFQVTGFPPGTSRIAQKSRDFTSSFWRAHRYGAACPELN